MLLLLFPTLAHARELAGVSVPDSATVGGQAVVLNGLGLREKYYIDVYVGALYLAKRTASGAEAIASDTPKRISMHFIYAQVTRDQLVETLREGFRHAPAAPAGTLDQLCGLMADVKAGDVVSFDYVPGAGTAISVRGRVKGTIPSKEFMTSLWSVFLGTSPPTARLKAGMLGG
jgi:hypothetical protein